ncbi:alpha-1,2-fucosyltransferase [Fictibacillus iocasae]|uniref:Alpha-1,2-fucosyltransferase n=1 Tax=Fictibacillus iocasae TaxID=2715437 RepID=A0ABW2NL99_9BACL
MIIVKVYGGLGNQLFQYFFGKALAEKYNTVVKYDLTFFSSSDNNEIRDFSIDKFNTNFHVANSQEINNFKKNSNTINRINKLTRILGIDKVLGNYYEELEEFKLDSKLITSINDNKYFQGYWQSYEYLKGIEGLIKNEMVLDFKESENFKRVINDIEKNESICLHVRRGDYVRLGWNLPLEYYTQALKKITANIPNFKLFIFSDDKEWILENFQMASGEVICINDFNFNDYEELYLMSKCKHNIISNSTFSWWGAYLNSNKGKIVIAPHVWVKGLNVKDIEIIPPTWTVL